MAILLFQLRWGTFQNNIQIFIEAIFLHKLHKWKNNGKRHTHRCTDTKARSVKELH